MEENSYSSEDKIQKLISEYPSLLAGDQMGGTDGKCWLLITREYNIPDKRESGGSWSIDHLFLDSEGIPTFVEVKRGEDPRVRRKVIGQMLDYVSHAVAHESGHNLRRHFEDQYGRKNAVKRVAEFIGGNDDDRDLTQEFWDGVDTNLRAGRVRMLFVADKMPPELRSVIEFLNEQMGSVEVLGVEIKRYSGENDDILVPSLVGNTTKSKEGSTSRSNPTTTLLELIESDEVRLSEGDELHMTYDNEEFTSTICQDGSVKFRGEKRSLSNASNKATELAGETNDKTRTNGWRRWKTVNGKKLDDIRSEMD